MYTPARRRSFATTLTALPLLLICLLAAACGGGSKHVSATGASSNPSGSSSASPVASSSAGSTESVAGPSVSPAPSTTVKAGSVDQTVPNRVIPTKKAVGVTVPASFTTSITTRVVSLKAIHATAKLPGEVAGPAVAVTISITNSTSKSIDLDSVVVNVTTAGGYPGNPMSTSPSNPLGGQLPAGAHATGTYVFTVPLQKRNPVSISVSYSSNTPVVLFVGNAE